MMGQKTQTEILLHLECIRDGVNGVSMVFAESEWHISQRNMRIIGQLLDDTIRRVYNGGDLRGGVMKNFFAVLESEAISEKAALVLMSAKLVADAWGDLTPAEKLFIREHYYAGDDFTEEMEGLVKSLNNLLLD